MDIPEELIVAARKRTILPFIGSGFSKNINPNFPNWDEAIKKATELLKLDYNVVKILSDNMQFAEYFDIEQDGIDKLIKPLEKILDDELNNKIEMSEPHLLLPYLDCSTIYTTNWDGWIERGFDNKKFPYSKIVDVKDLVNPKMINSHYINPAKKLRYPQTRIIKFHGDFSETKSIIIKESHYFNRFDFEDPLDLQLRAEIIGKSVLFIGYSFSDPNIKYLWHKLMKAMKDAKSENDDFDNNPKSFFVTSERNFVLEKILTNNHIKIIHLDVQNKKEDITNLFTQLIDAQK